MRNKAAEKAKHVHQNQQSQNNPNSNNSQTLLSENESTDLNTSPTGSISVITHTPLATAQQSIHISQGNNEQRSTGYSINGILGIHQTDPNGNSIKKRRIEDQG